MNGSDAFAFGLSENEMLRKTAEHKDYFQPIVVFRDSWFSMLAEAYRGSTPKESRHDTFSMKRITPKYQTNNVIHVDFTNKKKQQ